MHDTESRTETSIRFNDVCGLEANGNTLVLTSGESGFVSLSDIKTRTDGTVSGVTWDNQIVKVH